MGIIQDKITSGALKLYHDYRSGSMLDLSGNSQDGVANNTVPFTKNGLMLNRITNANNGYVSVPSNLGITGAISIVSVMTPNQAPDGIGNMIANVYDYNAGTDNGWSFGDNYGADDHIALSVYNAGSSDAAIYNNFWANHKGQRVCVVGTYEPSTAVNLYVDSILKGQDVTGVMAAMAMPDTETFRVGLRSDANNSPKDQGAWDGLFECVLVFNETLTVTEIAQLTAELKDMKFPTKTTNKNVSRKLQDSSVLTSHWIMEPQGDTIVDETGAGNDATVTNSPTFVNTLLGPGALLVDNLNRFDTGSDWVGTSSLTFGCWVNLDGYGNANAGRLFENGKTLLRWDGGNTRMLFSSDGSTSVTSATGSIQLNRLIFISVTRTAAGVTNCYVDGVLSGSADQASGTPVGGTNNVIFGNRNGGDKATEGVIIEPFAIVGTVETAAQILTRYKLGAGVVQFKTDWGAYASEQNFTSGFIGNTLWQRNTGTWKISTDTIDGENVKVLENVVAGNAYTQVSQLFMDSNDAAYGTWEFWAYKALDANLLNVQIMSDVIGNEAAAGQDAYTLSLETNESIRFRESTNGTPANKFLTGASYFAIATWYGYKITRSNLGVFTVYIKGGAFGNTWTIVDVSGGSGTNPVTDTTTTTSDYIIFDIDAGDKIAIADNSGNHSFVKYVGVI